MLEVQTSIPVSSYTDLYDKIIPTDNVLRRINDLIDFTFIYRELRAKYCTDNGRMAESPIRMFKYLLLKTIFDISDVDVVERSRYDMSFKYFLGMAPDSDVINPSSLCKFRRLRLKDTELLDLLIDKTVSIAIKRGIIKSKSIIVDATHTLSRSNPYKPVEILKLRSKQLRKMLYDFDETLKGSLPIKNEDDDLGHEIEYSKKLLDAIKGKETITELPKVKERLNMLRETLEDITDHFTTSEDKDARVGHKTEDSSFFGYKTHIAMTEERIITAAVVTSGDKGDGPMLPQLLEESKKHGMEVDTIIGDTAYSGDKNLKMGHSQGIDIVAKVHPIISHGTRNEDDKFEFNKDAGMYVCPAGHMAIRKAKQGKKDVQGNRSITYFFDVEKCKACVFRDKCYKPGAKSKTYSVTLKTDNQKHQIEFQETEYFKEKARQRYKIEAKNAELKHVYGYDRAESYGLSCMQMQGAMTIFAANIKRILKLV